MRGYDILVEEQENRALKGEGAGFLFLEREETHGEYPIPSAYAAYAEYLNQYIGCDNRKEDMN